MSLREARQHAGQLVMVGFDGHTVPAEIRSLVREFDLGGVVIFKRNVADPEQVAELCFELRGLGPETPLWVGIDQEGGRVARLRAGFTLWPPMATLGRADKGPELARRFARALARELSAVGVSLDFAPVLDVASNPNNPAIGDRALSDRAADVAALGRVIIDELQAAGVAACGKHFPGHGDTGVDSHLELPLVEHPPDRLRETEFVPFRAAIEAGVAAMMVGHLFVPALDEEHPATLSRKIVTGLLRGELGFNGLIVTDDLEMKAITARHAIERATAAAIGAGCDVALICGTDHDAQARAIEQVIREVEEEQLPMARVEDALARQRRAKARFLANLPTRPLRGQALRDQLARADALATADEMSAWA